MHYQIIDSLEAFRHQTREWDSLWQASSSHVAFHRALPLIRFAETFGHRDSFRAILIYDDHLPVLGLPLSCTKGFLNRWEAKSLVNYWTIQACVLDRPSPRQDERMLILAQAFRSLGLHQVCPDWLPLDWPSSLNIQAGWQGLGFSTWRKPRFQAAMLEVPGVWETYWKNLSRNLRKKLMAVERDLEQQGELTLETIDSQSVDGFMVRLEEAMQLELQSWKGQQGTAMASEPSIRQFFVDCYRDFAMCGIGRMFALRLNGKMIAFDLGYVMEGTYSSCKISFLPAFHKQSPGMLLTAKILEWLTQNQIAHRIDCIGEMNEATARWPHQPYESGRLNLSTGTFVGNQHVAVMSQIAGWLGKNTLPTSVTN